MLNVDCNSTLRRILISYNIRPVNDTLLLHVHRGQNSTGFRNDTVHDYDTTGDKDNGDIVHALLQSIAKDLAAI